MRCRCTEGGTAFAFERTITRNAQWNTNAVKVQENDIAKVIIYRARTERRQGRKKEGDGVVLQELGSWGAFCSEVRLLARYSLRIGDRVLACDFRIYKLLTFIHLQIRM